VPRATKQGAQGWLVLPLPPTPTPTPLPPLVSLFIEFVPNPELNECQSRLQLDALYDVIWGMSRVLTPSTSPEQLWGCPIWESAVHDPSAILLKCVQTAPPSWAVTSCCRAEPVFRRNLLLPSSVMRLKIAEKCHCAVLI
jgi:hypothetical protein